MAQGYTESNSVHTVVREHRDRTNDGAEKEKNVDASPGTAPPSQRLGQRWIERRAHDPARLVNFEDNDPGIQWPGRRTTEHSTPSC